MTDRMKRKLISRKQYQNSITATRLNSFHKRKGKQLEKYTAYYLMASQRGVERKTYLLIFDTNFGAFKKSDLVS